MKLKEFLLSRKWLIRGDSQSLLDRGDGDPTTILIYPLETSKTQTPIQFGIYPSDNDNCDESAVVGEINGFITHRFLNATIVEHGIKEIRGDYYTYVRLDMD